MQCNLCTFINREHCTNCEICGNELDELSEPEQISDFWHCQNCDYKFNENHIICLMCSNINESIIQKVPSIVYATSLKETHSYVEIHEYNMVIYRNSIDTHHQKLLVDDCRTKLKSLSMPGLALTEPIKNSKKMKIIKPGPTYGFSYQSGWSNRQIEDADLGTPACLGLATNLHESLIEKLDVRISEINVDVKESLRIPVTFIANSLWARKYNAENGLGFHQDPKGKDWAFIISLGADIEFEYYGPDEKRENARNLTIHSGDAVFFNGSELHHAVLSIIPGTEPDWWQEDYLRVGLQMRGFT